MKNGDMPAMPVSLGADGRPWTANDLGNGYAEQCRPAFGLTKREEFAMAAMQGLLVNMGRNGFNSVIEVASEAVNAADALLSALEGTK